MDENVRVILAGNPNVGKSTVFNALTGLKQHTGNWTGKTVEIFEGDFSYRNKKYNIIDVPGTYSLTPHSKEESVARDILCFSVSDKIMIVCDATSLERNLFFVYQILEMKKDTIICVNLLDEAKKKGIELDLNLLSYELGVNVIGTSARENKGLDELKEALESTEKKKIRDFKYSKEIEEAIEYIYPALNKIPVKGLDKRWLSLRLLDSDEEFFKSLTEHIGSDIRDDENISFAVKNAKDYLHKNGIDTEELKELITEEIYLTTNRVYKNILVSKPEKSISNDMKIDKILTSRFLAYPILMLMLFFVFYVTISLANIPSDLLMKFFTRSEEIIYLFMSSRGVNEFFTGMLVTGGYRVLGWVVSVMLPPMAIFFPLFTLLEDFGVLPRVAYVLDSKFQKAGTCGKQALTICMGFGCNCVGVSGARIIDSKREQLIAIITNAFTPCNGRFPAIIKLISIFFMVQFPKGSFVISSFLLSIVIVFSIAVTLLISNVLSKTLLKGQKSHYILELPSYRRPEFSKVIVSSLLNRTFSVLLRAVTVSFPAGIVIWLLLNLGEKQFLNCIVAFFSGLGEFMGVDGEILSSFVLGVPANEIVLPVCLMLYTGGSELLSVENTEVIAEILYSNGWSIKTAVCFIVFSLFHFPCATTLLTIYKETKSLKWLVVSFLLPTVLGVFFCSVISFIFDFFKV